MTSLLLSHTYVISKINISLFYCGFLETDSVKVTRLIKTIIFKKYFSEILIGDNKLSLDYFKGSMRLYPEYIFYNFTVQF